MTNCKIWFFYNNGQAIEILKDIANNEGLKIASTIVDNAQSFTLDIKTGADLDLSAGQKIIIKTVLQDLGVYLKWT